MYLVFTRMPGASYRRRLRSLLLRLCDVVRALINSLFCMLILHRRSGPLSVSDCSNTNQSCGKKLRKPKTHKKLFWFCFCLLEEGQLINLTNFTLLGFETCL